MDELLALLKKLKSIDSREITKYVVQQSPPKIHEEIRNAIQTWYASYSPRVYNRTYNFMTVGFTAEITGSGSHIFIAINSDSIDDYAYNTADYVFTGIVDHGFHGSPLKAPASEPVGEIIDRQIGNVISDTIDQYMANILNI